MQSGLQRFRGAIGNAPDYESGDLRVRAPSKPTFFTFCHLDFMLQQLTYEMFMGAVLI